MIIIVIVILGACSGEEAEDDLVLVPRPGEGAPREDATVAAPF